MHLTSPAGKTPETKAFKDEPEACKVEPVIHISDSPVAPPSKRAKFEGPADRKLQRDRLAFLQCPA